MTGEGQGVISGGEQRQSFSARYGARPPLLAPWPRAGLYLLWRAVMTVSRPAVFLVLVIAAVWLALSAAQRLPVETLADRRGLDQTVQVAFARAAPHRSDRRSLWVDGAFAALDAPPQTAPDLPLAESFARAAIWIEGEDALAMRLLSRDRPRHSVEAELRARPATQRAARLDAALEQLRMDGLAAGLDPPALILAPAALSIRLGRAQTLYGPALNDADGWFADSRGRALSMSSLPGVGRGAPDLYGDVRDVLVQGCALARDNGRGVRQCRVAFLPKPASDPVLAGLALAVIGAAPAERPGARLAKAAYAAGRLDRRLAQRLALGPDPDLGREALIASLLPVLNAAGEAWTQPVRFEAALSEASREARASARIDEAGRTQMFAALAAVRRDSGALAALRLGDVITGADEAERLARSAEIAGRQLLALHALDRGELAHLLQARAQSDRYQFSRWPRAARMEAGLAAGCLTLALAVLIASLAAGYRRRRGGPPGALERLDAAMIRLTLGKNC